MSTLAKSDARVQDYQRDSKAVAASVSDRLKISNSNTAKCLSAMETLAKRYAAVASRNRCVGPLVRHPCRTRYGYPAPAIGGSTRS